MSSIETLRKTLDQKMKEATAERHEAKRPLQANYWLGYAEGLEKAQDLFSVFQQDYDKMKKNWAKDRDAMFDYLTEAEELKRELKSIKTNNVVVSRKQLSELEKLKQQKLEQRAFKHPNENNFLNPKHKTFILSELFEHWLEENQEFVQGYKNGDLENMKEELADISNMVDMMFETVVKMKELLEAKK